MSKRSPKKQSGSRRNVYIGGAVILVVVAIAAVFLSGNSAAAAESISPADYQTRFTSGNVSHLLLDVRTPEEFAEGHLHGAVNIPIESLSGRLNEVPNSQLIVIYCRSGNRSAQAAQILAQAVYTSLYDLGGIKDWTAQGYPVE